MPPRPVKLMAVWFLLAVALTALLALPLSASLCTVLTATALGYGVSLLGQTGRDLT